MGQAAEDLPDPLEQSPQQSALSADDLLAKMAGDEIDRLLAEADAPRPEAQDGAAAPSATPPAEATPSASEPDPAPAPPTPAESEPAEPAPATPAPAAQPAAPAAEAPSPEEQEPQLASQLDALFSQLAGKPADQPVEPAVPQPPAAPPAEPAPEPPSDAAVPEAQAAADASSESDPAEPQLAAQLDALFSQLGGKAPTEEEFAAKVAAAKPAVPAPAPAVTDQPPASTQPQSAAAAPTAAAPAASAQPAQAEAGVDPSAATSATERAALNQPVPEVDASAIQDQLHEQLAQAKEDDDRLPWYLLPLEWINAPLAYCPDWLRNAIGVIAIATLLVAAGIFLSYLALHRQGH